MNIVKAPTTRRKTQKPQGLDQMPIGIGFDIQSLNLFCMYIMSENASIRTHHLSMMKKLFDRIDLDRYRNDPERLLRIEFIKRGLQGRIIQKIKNRDVLMKYINGGMEEQPLMMINLAELSSEEIEWINGTISESLKHAFMYDYVDEIIDICTRFKQEDYVRKGTIVEEFETVVDRVKKEFRKAKNESATEIEFSLAEGVFEEILYDVYQRETNPSRRLLTGMQGFNELVGGGLESGRVYMLFGMAGAGKSLTMLNIAYQIKKYNKGYQCKDRTKKPCICILTMENSVHETITRLFSLVAGQRMSNFSYEEVVKKLKEDGELYLNDESPIDIFIKYKPNMSCDTTYLYSLYDELEERGFEMICLLQDHIKRIRPAFPRHDMRLDLGENVNDFKTFAIEKDIPVISDSHLNRDGARVIDSALSANKQDITRLLGRSNVGESMLMIDNTDCGIIINKEYDKDGREYIIFFRQKMRDEASKRDYIAQPFVVGSSIRLVEDLYDTVPAFKESLYEAQALINNNKANVRRNDYSMNIKQIDDDDSIFSMKPQEISISQMQYNVVGTPSQPIYNNYGVTPQQSNQQSMYSPIQPLQQPTQQTKPAIYFVDDAGSIIY